MANQDEDSILLNVGLNTGEAEQQIQQLKKQVQGVGDTPINDIQVKGYRVAIRELTQELQILERTQGRNSDAFREGAAQLGKLKLAAADFKNLVEDFNPANRFAGIANIAKGAAVGMTGAAGAMALFGVKGEKAEEVMLRLQGILALSHAISSIHELSNGWNSFLNILGLNSKNVQTLTEQQKAMYAAQQAAKDSSIDGIEAENVAYEDVTDTINEQQVALERLNAAQAEVDQLAIDAETALNAAKAEGLDATAAMTGAEQAYLEIMAAKSVALKELTAAQVAYDESVSLGTANAEETSEANIAQVASTEAVAVAEEGATAASVGLKVALWSIGIGLITTAIAYLVSNWKEVKASILDLFPALNQTKSVFKEFQNDLLGVGNAVLHVLKSPIDEAVTAIKILIDVLHGDFKAAANEFKAGVQQQVDDWNVLANFKDGVSKAETKDAIEAGKKRVQEEVDANERIIKERKALGQDTYALEIKNQQLKNSLLDKDADDYKKKLLDGQSEITILQNQEIKKRQDAADKLRKQAADKAAALKKQELDRLKAGENEASKVIQAGITSQRDIEISNAEFKYNKLIDIAKKYGKDTSELEKALGIEKALINKKYTDQITEYLNKTEDENLSEFDKRRKKILEEAQAAMKNANPDEANKIFASSFYQTQQVDREEQLSNASDTANIGVTNAENTNRASVIPGKDTAQDSFNKEEAIRKAKIIALQAQYAKEQDLARNDAQKQLQLKADFEKNSKDLEDEGTKARIELAQAEKDAKLATYDEVSQGLTAAADIAGKNTVAGKALAVAGATISTYLSATQAYLSQFLPVPDISSPFRGAIAAGVAVAAGLANVKSILSVKVPGSSGSVGAQTPSYSAPTINSTLLNQSQQGIQNVNVVNQPDQKKQEPIKAYVVERDITSAQDRAAYLNRRSTI